MTRNLTFALTLALTVWMYSKWPPSGWKVIGFWLKNHWKATSNDVSWVTLQLSTTLSPTVTSTLLGLSSTCIASGSTKLLHCHLRLTQSYLHEAELTIWEMIRTQTYSLDKGDQLCWINILLDFAWDCFRLTEHLWERSLYAALGVSL